MKAISLFSGMGGDTLGLEDAGVEVVAFSEKDKWAIKSHLANFPNSELIGDGDITNVDWRKSEYKKYKDIDILFAGFPCQSFSTAGKRKVGEKNDPRNTMFKYFVRAAKALKPKVIIGENVKGLLTKKTYRGKNYIDVIVSEFENLGYDVKYGLLKCEEHGVPQKRVRLFIVGTLSENPLSIKNVNNKPYISLPAEQEVGIRSFVEPTLEKSHIISKNQLDLSDKSDKIVEAFDDQTDPHPYLLLKMGKSEDHYWNGRQYEYRGTLHDSLFSFGKRDSPIHCEVVDIDKPVKTIICTYSSQPRMFVPVHKDGDYYARSFTIDELKQIQSFPKDFVVEGSEAQQVKQIGNAVPPRICTKLVKEILNVDEN